MYVCLWYDYVPTQHIISMMPVSPSPLSGQLIQPCLSPSFLLSLSCYFSPWLQKACSSSTYYLYVVVSKLSSTTKVNIICLSWCKRWTYCSLSLYKILVKFLWSHKLTIERRISDKKMVFPQSHKDFIWTSYSQLGKVANI